MESLTLIGIMEANPELVVEAASPTLHGPTKSIPKLVPDRASPTSTGFSEVLAKSFVMRQRTPCPYQEQLLWLDRKKGKRKQNC